jgi:hypothetical protein
MFAARFCYRCGRRFHPQDPGWCVCGAQRRHLQTAPPGTSAAAEWPFRWVWCHFFRNALAIGCMFCLLAATVTGNVLWVLVALPCGAGAKLFHVYHENVCEGRRPLRPGAAESQREGNGDANE